MKATRKYRAMASRRYDEILAGTSTGRPSELPEPSRCIEEACNEYVPKGQERCNECQAKENVPPECRGKLWDNLTQADRLQLIAAFRGWKMRRAKPVDPVLAEMNRRCDAGEFESLEELEAAWREIEARPQRGAA